MPRLIPAFIVCYTTAAVTTGVSAVSFGSFTTHAQLGRPLNVAVPVHLEPGESFAPGCVKAQVEAGGVALPSSDVRVQWQPTADPHSWLARVSTHSAIEEPIVEFTVNLGCPQGFSRRYTLFADPPFVAAGAADGQADLFQMREPGRASASRLMIDSDAAQTSRVADRAALRQRDVRGKAKRADSVGKPKIATAAVRNVAQTAAGRTADAAPRGARLLLDVGVGPRLRMDIEDPVFMPASMAAAASDVGADPLSADFDRLKVLEKTLSDLKHETESSRAAETQLKTQLAQAQSRSRWTPWLAGLLLLSLAGLAWLAWLLKRKAEEASFSKEKTPRWWVPSSEPVRPAAARVVAVADDAPASIAGELMDAPLPEVEESGHSALTPLFGRATEPMPMPEAALSERTMALPPASAAVGGVVEGAPAREVSVEELMDLEQQADFFIALGQEDAAVDLLMSHLRGTGGQSPLPYTKLLEIYRRQGDRAAYERIRARFNRRFNAYAPDWDIGPMHGRSLEEYPEVIRRLEKLWSSPLNAMAELEAMLFRNDERQELFDLPAYKDVLVLYSLARDLYQQDGVSNADIDLLLPLGEDPAASNEEPRAVSNGAAGSAAAPSVARRNDDDKFEMTSFAPHNAPAPDGGAHAAKETEPGFLTPDWALNENDAPSPRNR